MPYSIRVNDDRCTTSEPFAVVQADSNRLAGCHTTRGDAEDQIVALNIAEVEGTAVQSAATRSNTMAKEHKNFPALSTKIVDGDEGIVEHIITVFGILDYGNDISHPGSFTKTLAERGHKSLVLDMHNTDSVMNVLGKPLSIMEVGREQLPPEVLNEFPEATGGVKAITQFFMDTPEGHGAFIRLKRDGIREWSYGYDALDVDFSTVTDGEGQDVNARNLRTVKLYEYGPVLWGMCPATTTISAKGGAQGDAPQEDDMDTESKGVTGATNLPLASRTRAWDASAAQGRVRNWADATEGPNAQYRRAFFWYDSDNPDLFGSYKLPFADVIDGELHAVPRGIFAGAQRLSATDIPETDKDGVRRRMGRYYGRMRTEFEDDGIVPSWEKAVAMVPENKAVNLTDVVDSVVSAFCAQYPDVFEPPEGRNIYWVRQVWDEFVIVKQDGGVATATWRIPYSIVSDRVVFMPPEVWQEVAIVFVPVREVEQMGAILDAEAKIGRAISAANGQRIADAITTLVQLLEGAGVDIPGFGDQADMHEDEDDKSAPVSDEQAAKDQQKAADTEAGPDVQPPTSEGDTLAIDPFEIEREALELLKLGG